MRKMTKEEKRILFRPKEWGLFQNGILIGTYPSRATVKRAQHYKLKEDEDDWLDYGEYTIKKLD